MSSPTGAWLLEQPKERQTPEIKVEFYRRDNLKLDYYRGSGRSFTALKLLLVPSYRSTDFEVHRNWLAITHSLPLSEWYINDTSEWTLDYPPLFAWFEWLLSQAAAYVEPGMLNVSSVGFDSPSTILFQRCTVIVSDVVLLGAAYAVTRPSQGHTRRSGLVTFFLVAANAGLLMVDHCHFQFNGMLLGVLLWATHAAQRGSATLACLLFAALINAKHLFAYAGPVFLVYLMRSYCCCGVSSSSTPSRQSRTPASQEGLARDVAWQQRGWEKRSSCSLGVEAGGGGSSGAGGTRSGGFLWGRCIRRFLWLGAVGASVTALAFGPFLALGQGPQLLRRLFPFGRGLVHAYWAANIWALYCGLDKLAAAVLPLMGVGVEKVAGNLAGGLVGVARFSVLPQVEPGATMLLVLLALAPCLVFLWRHPHPRHLPSAVAYAYLSGFVFGFHVHEKAALMALLPLAASATGSRAAAADFLVLSSAAHYALFPLLYRPEEYHIKLLMALLYFAACHAGLAWVLQEQAGTSNEGKDQQQQVLQQQQQQQQQQHAKPMSSSSKAGQSSTMCPIYM
ncbi:MAG: hypothetical protein WDW36_006881 [Sanguina aurantia]